MLSCVSKDEQQMSLMRKVHRSFGVSGTRFSKRQLNELQDSDRRHDAVQAAVEGDLKLGHERLSATG